MNFLLTIVGFLFLLSSCENSREKYEDKNISELESIKDKLESLEERIDYIKSNSECNTSMFNPVEERLEYLEESFPTLIYFNAKQNIGYQPF